MITDERSPFPAGVFAKLAALEAGHWWFRSRNAILLWALQTKLHQPFYSFLEVGCGTGFVLEGIRNRFPAATLYGAEYYEEGLKFARGRVPSASFCQLDATTMTEINQYDVIGAFDVIEHIENDALVLKNFARALTPGGVVMISVPQHRWLWSAVDVHACHVRRYIRSELWAKVKAADLEPQYVTSFVSLLVPLMWIMRRKPAGASYDPMAEFEIPNWQNVILESVMKVELALLKAGIRFPFGGSLLLIARKGR
ncbi:class I SAM-dependent methyltransferase [Nitrobacter sp.]|uniref:class I SAM-dependent methyltransferase n=1 Tax=Nitrobacter sp. TaxID=29420 RepID=UPI0029CAC22B|nr:class I SAM-dependent methyltransferase [Nitrobacter sp.]